MKWRVAAGILAAAAWAGVAWLLWRSSVPSFALPQLDPRSAFPPDVLDRAAHYDRGARLLWLGSTIVKLGALALFARFGFRWSRESAAGPIGTGMLLGMLGFALVWVVQLPFDVLEVWWRHRYGRSGSYVEATVGTWLLLGTEFVFLCFSLGVVMGLARARRIGAAWWIPAAPVFVGLTLLFAFIAPWLLGGRPYHADVQRLERIERVRHVPVRVLDGFEEPNAFATGIGASRRVFLWEPILEPPFTAREDRFVIAHELGHLAHEHIWRSIGWYALFAFPGTFLLARAARRRGGMARPEAVPLAILAAGVWWLLTSVLAGWKPRRTGRRCAPPTTRLPRGCSSGTSRRSRSRTRIRRGGATCCSRTIRRCCSASRWRATTRRRRPSLRRARCRARVRRAARRASPARRPDRARGRRSGRRRGSSRGGGR